MNERVLGFALVAVSAVFWSSAGAFMRFLDLDVWTIVFWRALFASIAMALIVLPRTRRRAATFGWPGLCGAILIAISELSFLAALNLTTVANVTAIYATLPLVAAGLAYLLLDEKVGRRLVIASLVSLSGIVLVAGASLNQTDVTGDLLAFTMTLAFALVVLVAKRFPRLDLAAVNALGALLCSASAAPLMSAAIPSAVELAILAAFGVTTTACAYVLFLTGSRMITAAEATLIALLDVLLAPLWVWLLFSERPHDAVIVGGLVILCATVWTLKPTVGSARRIGSDVVPLRARR